MARKNPYDRDLRRGQFRITYAGLDKGYYCFRVHLGGHVGLDAQAMEAALSQWLFMNARDWHMGNGFHRTPDKPQVELPNPDFTDTFVLLRRIIDVAAFENEFGVEGFSPTSLAPGYVRRAA